MKPSPRSWKRTFFGIWAGQAFSILGSSAAQFALVWWLTIQTGSPLVLAIASIAGFLPMALIGPIAGVWVDRLPRKAIMIAADLFIAAVSAVLALVFLFGTPMTWHVYGILFLRAVGSVFHSTALQAALPLLVPEDQLVKTGGWSQLLTSGSLMVGPVLGTFLMALGSVPLVMGIDAVGAAIAVSALAFVHIVDPPPSTEERHLLREMRQGFGEIRSNRGLRLISVPIMVTSLVYIPVSSLFPLMVNGHFSGTAWHASTVECLFAGGMLVSSLVLGVWGGLRNKFAMINLAIAALGLSLVVSGALPSSSFLAFAGLSALMGMTGNFFTVPFIAYIQSTIPPAALGRVLSLLTSLFSLAVPLGLFLAAPIAERVGVARWFSVSGVLIVLAAVLGAFLTRELSVEEDAPASTVG